MSGCECQPCIWKARVRLLPVQSGSPSLMPCQLTRLQNCSLLSAKWRLRFAAHGLDGLTDERRSRKCLLAHPRFVLPFTPTSSSWMHLVERWFAELTTKLLGRGAHRSLRALNTDIRAWIETWNDNPRPYIWTKTADQILETIARYCERINDSGH